MSSLLLQKPSFKAKSKEHSISLARRLNLWNEGDFDALVREARAIQSTLSTNKKFKTPEQLSRTFSKLMLQCKVNAALRVLDEESSGGILPLTNTVFQDLQSKHPLSQPATESVMIQGDKPFVDPAIFANIDETTIAKCAMKTKDAAGPSGLDAIGWRRMLVSQNYGLAGKDLRESIAAMARNLSTRKVEINNSTTNIEAYLSCRLIPLDKKPGVRPIGVGEVLRRIIGKAIIATIKPEILKSAGSLQLCAGQQVGCEAAVHAMNQIFAEEETDALLLVDATNAFNSINRKVMLHNIQYLCPSMSTYTYNCYCTASRLFVQGGKEILSMEGTTQGDSIAMPMYAIGIIPLLEAIKDDTTGEIKQAAFADDLSGAGKLTQLRSWWDNIMQSGPLLGYYPRADKSWLIIKQDLLQEATEIFKGTDMKITVEGHKYLGGYIGTDEGKFTYVQNLVSKWMKQLETLAAIARHEPQAAYAAYVSGFQHRFTYHIRTLPDIKPLLQQLDHVIDHKFLPAILEDRPISMDERKLIALPVRLGGLSGKPELEVDMPFTNSQDC